MKERVNTIVTSDFQPVVVHSLFIWIPPVDVNSIDPDQLASDENSVDPDQLASDENSVDPDQLASDESSVDTDTEAS